MKLCWRDLWIWPNKSDEIDSAEYLIYGFILFSLKYNLDRLLATFILKEPLYDSIGLLFRLGDFFSSNTTSAFACYRLALIISSLPFLYIAIVITLKRLYSVGLKWYWIVPFFAPFVNLILFLVVGLLPAVNSPPDNIQRSKILSRFNTVIPRGMLASTAFSTLLTSIIALLITIVGITLHKNYGFILFLLTPFLLGMFPVLIFSLRQQRTFIQCFIVSIITTTAIGLLLLAFAVEGVFCILMAAPLAYLITFLGALLAYFIQRDTWKRFNNGSENQLLSLLLLFITIPFLMGAEADMNIQPHVYAVKSSVMINAKPDKIWHAVVAFTKIPPPKETMFRAGIAYPIQARIYGHGVGAVRHCIFSTGPFVEPITVWDAPHLLKFNVAQQPPIMREFSPYPNLQPPHVDNYLMSQGGQFLLTPMSNGKTLLEGTTWYTHKIWPQVYWHLWSDAVIHQIHMRVLTHIKTEVENS